MPLTEKGQKILANMKREYGEKEGERNFYKSRNAGTISGVDGQSRVQFKGGPYVSGRDRGAKK